jgi:uncharacterized membrane protein YqiK
LFTVLSKPFVPIPAKARAGAQAEATRLNASADAEMINKTGLAEAEKIMAIGKSTAEAYELQVKAMGGDNFTNTKSLKK